MGLTLSHERETKGAIAAVPLISGVLFFLFINMLHLPVQISTLKKIIGENIRKDLKQKQQTLKTPLDMTSLSSKYATLPASFGGGGGGGGAAHEADFGYVWNLYIYTVYIERNVVCIHRRQRRRGSRSSLWVCG